MKPRTKSDEIIDAYLRIKEVVRKIDLEVQRDLELLKNQSLAIHKLLKVIEGLKERPMPKTRTMNQDNYVLEINRAAYFNKAIRLVKQKVRESVG